MNDTNVIRELAGVIDQRKGQSEEGSYTCYLFEKGTDKILKKCGEECAEMIIAAKNDSKEELAGEIADLVYHVLVLMKDREVPVDLVEAVLRERSQKMGNLKTFHQVDKNT